MKASSYNVVVFYLGSTKLLSTPPDGYRFGGDGYIIMDRERFPPRSSTVVQFDFRTYDENGLMLLLGEEENFGDFFSIELKDGRVLFQFDLGSGNGDTPATAFVLLR